MYAIHILPIVLILMPLISATPSAELNPNFPNFGKVVNTTIFSILNSTSSDKIITTYLGDGGSLEEDCQCTLRHLCSVQDQVEVDEESG